MYAIVIPSLNPGSNLPEYCRELRKLTQETILLIDDGSDGKHAGIFDECTAACDGVVYLRHNKNRGKGRALKTAFIYLLENFPDCYGCVTADSDGQHAPHDVVKCLDALRANSSALVLGCRTFAFDHVPWRSRFGNKTMTKMFRLATGHIIRDTQTGLRAIPADFMRELIDVKGERFEFETRMLLSLRGRTLIQTDISTIYEDGNKGSHFNPIRDSAKIFSILLRKVLYRLLVFSVASILSFLVDIGLFYSLYNLVLNEQSSGRLVISIVAARAVSMVFNYIANRYVVFAESDKKHAFGRHSFIKYLILALCIMGCSYLFTKGANRLFPHADITLVKATVDIVLFIASYTFQRFFVFRPE